MYRNKVIILGKKARATFYKNSIKNIQETNPKKWWDNIKLLSSLSKPVTHTSIIADGVTLKDSDLAEALNDCLNDVACDIDKPLGFNPLPVEQSTDNYVVSLESVEKALLSIQERKAKSTDDIPYWILKNFASIIHRPICSIFNSSINQDHVLLLWKCANVILISSADLYQYDFRPISLTPDLSKILEGFVLEWFAAIIMPQVLDPFQFGRVKKSPTSHALVRLIY